MNPGFENGDLRSPCKWHGGFEVCSHGSQEDGQVQAEIKALNGCLVLKGWFFPFSKREVVFPVVQGSCKHDRFIDIFGW